MYNIINKITYIFLFFVTSLILFVPTYSQNNKRKVQSPEEIKEKQFLKQLKTEAENKEIDITVKSVEITNFPTIKLIVEAYNKLGEPLDTLLPSQITIFENGKEFPALDVQKIPVANNLPWDLVFLMDVTGSMQPQIDGVVNNLLSFTKNLQDRGIDYRLGLILFGDNIERVYQLTSEAESFLSWIKDVRAKGGGDEKENALEALVAASHRIQYRPEANKVAILITDAPYHQKGETGDGRTNETTESIIDRMNRSDIRVFSITPPKLKAYAYISEQTRGTNYDIAYSFTNVLENFTRQITNLFLVTYKSSNSVIPDSIEIGLFDQVNSQIIKKTIPIVELGRKLIIENLLFQTARFELPLNVSELNILAEFMVSKPLINVTIEGHTDSIGSHQINDLLSERRAESVKKYIVSKGVDASRIQTMGFGKRRPIASNDNEFGRGLNRRTEIVINSK
jgi:outer membrane protein OmpA-like peptidoglycan-associated protein/Mg-chelatase subunit ChlD